MSFFALHFPSTDPAGQCIYFARHLVPNSSELNPLDSKIWVVMQEQIYQTKVYDVDALRQCLIDVWHGLGQSIISDTCNESHRCLAWTWTKHH